MTSSSSASSSATLNWMDFWSLTDAQAISRVHPEDRKRVLDTHSRLPGQTLASTVFNALRHELVRASDVTS